MAPERAGRCRQATRTPRPLGSRNSPTGGKIASSSQSHNGQSRKPDAQPQPVSHSPQPDAQPAVRTHSRSRTHSLQHQSTPVSGGRATLGGDGLRSPSRPGQSARSALATAERSRSHLQLVPARDSLPRLVRRPAHCPGRCRYRPRRHHGRSRRPRRDRGRADSPR